MPPKKLTPAQAARIKKKINQSKKMTVADTRRFNKKHGIKKPPS